MGLQSLFADWNLKQQLSLHTDSSSAKATSSRRTGKSARHIQTRMLWLQERVAAKHLRVVKVASESNPADMLTKALGRSKIEEFCAEIGQTEPCAETLDKESKRVKKTKEVKFAVETIEMYETVKNRFKDARIAKIKNESKVEKLQWMHTRIDFSKIAETVVSVEDGQMWNQKGSLNPGTQSWMEIAALVKD